MPSCSSCNQPLDADSKFCKYCGTPVSKTGDPGTFEAECPSCRHVSTHQTVPMQSVNFRNTGGAYENRMMPSGNTRSQIGGLGGSLPGRVLTCPKCKVQFRHR